MKKLFLSLALSFIGTAAFAADEYNIAIKDHKFTPVNIEVPADVRIKLVIDNQDVTPEEFESYDLHREKIIQGNSKAVIFVGPLKAGTYKYFGEFNEKTAQGTITVK